MRIFLANIERRWSAVTSCFTSSHTSKEPKRELSLLLIVAFKLVPGTYFPKNNHNKKILSHNINTHLSISFFHYLVGEPQFTTVYILLNIIKYHWTMFFLS